MGERREAQQTPRAHRSPGADGGAAAVGGAKQGRSKRWTARHVRSLRLACASLLLACLGLLGMAGAAGAATYDMRGEWDYALTCSCGQKASGTMMLRSMEPVSGEYSGTIALEGFNGTVSGTVSGSSLSLKIVLPNTPFGEYTFTVQAGTIEAAKNEVSGSGVYTTGHSTEKPTGTIRATRIRSLAQIEKEEQEAVERAREAREKAEKETKEREAKEAEERPIKEKEAAEKREREAQEKQQAKEQQEAKERQEAKEQQEAKTRQEAKEREEKASKEAAAGSGQNQTPGTGGAKQGPTNAPGPAPAKPSTKTLAVNSSGLVSLELSNSNQYAISGDVALAAASAGKAASATGKGKTALFANASFTISPYAKKLVRLKLSKSAAAALANHKSLRVAIKITTRATGHSSTTKTYTVTLQAASRTRH